MRNPLVELGRLLGAKSPGMVVGRVVAIDPVTGGSIVAAAGKAIDAGRSSYPVGTEVVLGSDGRIVGRSPESTGIFWVE